MEKGKEGKKENTNNKKDKKIQKKKVERQDVDCKQKRTKLKSYLKGRNRLKNVFKKNKNKKQIISTQIKIATKAKTNNKTKPGSKLNLKPKVKQNVERKVKRNSNPKLKQNLRQNYTI